MKQARPAEKFDLESPKLTRERFLFGQSACNRKFGGRRGHPIAMLESGPNNPAIAARGFKHHSQIQQLIKYPLDTAFSEKELIIEKISTVLSGAVSKQS
jgi:hypothetical protein